MCKKVKQQVKPSNDGTDGIGWQPNMEKPETFVSTKVEHESDYYLVGTCILTIHTIKGTQMAKSYFQLPAFRPG